MVFGLGLMPGLIVHMCPTLTRIRGHVQSTWNELTNSDHQPISHDMDSASQMVGDKEVDVVLQGIVKLTDHQ